MGMQAGKIVVKRSRGKLVINAMAQTPRGTQFIKATRELKVEHVGEKDFKTEMAKAVEELIGKDS